MQIGAVAAGKVSTCVAAPRGAGAELPHYWIGVWMLCTCVSTYVKTGIG